MKCISAVVACACVVAVSAGFFDNFGSANQYGHIASGVNDYGKGQYASADGNRKYNRYDNAANTYNTAAGKYASHGDKYYKNADNAAVKGNAATNYYGQKAASNGKNAYGDAANAKKLAYNDNAANHYARKDDRQKAYANHDNAHNNYYRKGNVFDTNVKYGFDKKYNKNSDDGGDYEIVDASSSHNIADYRDHNGAANFANRDHKAKKYAADASKALKDGKYGYGAANAKTDNAKYASAASHSAKNNGANHVAATKLAEAAGSNKYYKNAHDASKNQYDNFSGKNGYYNKKNLADSLGQAAHNLAGHGAASHGAHGVHGGFATGFGKGGYGKGLGHNNYGQQYGRQYGQQYGQLGHAAQGLYDAAAQGQHATHYNSAADAAAARSGKYGLHAGDSKRNQAGAAYHRNGFNNAQGNDYHKFGAGAAKNNAFKYNDAAAAANKYGYDHAGADAARRTDANSALSDSAKSAYAKDNFRRKYNDAAKKHHLVKKFHHHSNAGGNNYERLNYDKKDYRDSFGQNANAAHANANKAAQTYQRNAANAAAHNNNKYSANHKANNYKYHDAAQKKNGNAASKSNYYGRNAANAAGANNAADQSKFQNHHNAAAGQAHALNDYAHNGYASNARAHNGAHGAAANHGAAVKHTAPYVNTHGLSHGVSAGKAVLGHGGFAGNNVFRNGGAIGNGFGKGFGLNNGFAARKGGYPYYY